MIGHDHLWEIVLIYRKTGTDGNGQPTHSAAGIVARAHVTRKSKTLKTVEGTDIISTAQVTLPPGVPVSNGDKIILREGTSLLVQEASPSYGDYSVLSHWVAFL